MSALAGQVMTAKLRCLLGARRAPVLPNGCEGERLAGLRADGVGLLGLGALDGAPFEEIVDREQAATAAVGVPEGRQGRDGFPPWR
jgi:hypothetical protein